MTEQATIFSKKMIERVIVCFVCGFIPPVIFGLADVTSIPTTRALAAGGISGGLGAVLGLLTRVFKLGPEDSPSIVNNAVETTAVEKAEEAAAGAPATSGEIAALQDSWTRPPAVAPPQIDVMMSEDSYLKYTGHNGGVTSENPPPLFATPPPPPPVPIAAPDAVGVALMGANPGLVPFVSLHPIVIPPLEDEPIGDVDDIESH